MDSKTERGSSVKIIANGNRTPTPSVSGEMNEEIRPLTDSRTFRLELIDGERTLTQLLPNVDEAISSPV